MGKGNICRDTDHDISTLMKDFNPQIHKFQWTVVRMNTYKTIPKNVTVKLLKNKHKVNNSKRIRGKRHMWEHYNKNKKLEDNEMVSLKYWEWRKKRCDSKPTISYAVKIHLNTRAK